MDAEGAKPIRVWTKKAESIAWRQPVVQLMVKGDNYDTAWIVTGVIDGRNLVRVEGARICCATIDERN
jgi:hypothetical protein